MKKQSLLFGASGLVVGIAITWGMAVAAINGNNTSLMDAMGMHPKTVSQATGNNTDDMSMSQMMDSLRGKTGDDFDKTFVSEMIMHHQGAIDMANLAKQNAKHGEIKAMANDIVSAQTKEINQMQMWQTEWGYTSSSSSHDMMNMGH